MKYVELIIAAIHILIRIAEATNGPGTGENKKSFVMRTIESIIGIFARFSTGGQGETWKGISGIFAKLSEPISGLIDVMVDGLFNIDDESKPAVEFFNVDEVNP